MEQLRPFVKWVGGKTQLLPAIASLMPKTYRHYYEPFLGGGALLFHIQPDVAYISDINPVLVQTYRDIRNHPTDFMQATHDIDVLLQVPTFSQQDRNQYYLSCRSAFNKLLREKDYGLKSSALFLFLNKHCFNGLYRTNQRGEFNAPFAYTARNSFQKEHIAAVSRFLSHRGIHLAAQDFALTCALPREGDFVFIDSPYAPLTDNSFVSYTKSGFPASEHVRLALTVRDMAERGVKVMVTNHDTPFIHELYDGFSFRKVPVHRNINCDGAHRYGEEVIITTYPQET